MIATHARPSRRTLLKGGLAVGTGLVIGFRLPLLDRLPAEAQGPGVFAPSKDQFRYIGKARSRVDVPQKVNGQAVYGIDVKVRASPGSRSSG